MSESAAVKARPDLINVLIMGAFAAAALLSLTPMASTRFYSWPWFLYWQLLLLAPVAYRSWRLLSSRGHPAFGHGIDLGLTAVIAASVASSLACSHRATAFGLTLITASGCCLAWILLQWVEGAPENRAIRRQQLGVGLGVLMATFTATSYLWWALKDIQPAMAAGRSLAQALAIRNIHPLGHSTYTAGVIVLALPWLCHLTASAASYRGRIGWALAAASTFTLAFTADNRGAVAAIGIMAGMGTLLYLRHVGFKSRRGIMMMAGALAAVISMFMMEPRLRSLIKDGRWSSLATESNQQRSAMLQAGLLMGNDRPLTGQGPGGVPLAYPAYRTRLADGASNVLELHNTPVQIWAELGAAGSLAALLLVSGFLRLAVGMRHQLLVEKFTAPVAIGLSATGFAVFSLTDYQFDIPLITAICATLLVLAKTWHESPDQSRSPNPAFTNRIGGVLLMLLLGVWAWFCVPDIRARALFSEAGDARVQGDDKSFVSLARKASATMKEDAFYPLQMAAFHHEKYLLSKDPGQRAATETELLEALSRHPHWDFTRYSLGWMLLAKSPLTARVQFNAAARLAPEKSSLYHGIGLTHLATGDKNAAVTAFAMEWLNNPTSVTSPVWMRPPLAEHRSDIRARARTLASEWISHLEAGPPSDRIRYSAALADWWFEGRLPEAGELAAAPGNAVAFFRALPSIENRTYRTPDFGVPAPWEQLYGIWRSGDKIVADPSNRFMMEVNSLLASRSSFRELLVATPQSGSALEGIQTSQRVNMGVLMRQQDGFPLVEMSGLPDNRMSGAFLGFLFPASGQVPSRLLLQTLDGMASTQ